MTETVTQGDTADRRTETAARNADVAARNSAATACNADAAARVTPASTRVIEAVAAAADVDPLAMDPLYDVIDPDALDRLVEDEIEGHVQFTFAGHEVTVRGDGTVAVGEVR